MHPYVMAHLSDSNLLRDLDANVSQERGVTAIQLAQIAEVDARRLYVPAGYPSIHSFCVGQLHMTDDEAYKRIQAARAARRFPALFFALADVRLHLTAIVVLAPALTPENADDLIAAATHRSKAEIQQLLARRNPLESLAAPVPPVPSLPEAVQSDVELVPEPVADRDCGLQTVPPADADPYVPLQLRMRRSAHDKLAYAQALLSHSLPSGDAAEVVERALDLLIAECEKRKFASTSRPRAAHVRPTSAPRHIPAHVKRAVWERDQGRCTFIGNTGHRCGSRKFLEFDHADPVARGGGATVERMRLRCRAHNQYEAERIFGTEFIESRREQARRAAAEARATSAAAAGAAAAAEQTRLVTSGLRQLGCRPDEARRAAEQAAAACDGGTLEEHLRAALKLLRPPRSTVVTETSCTNAASSAPADPATVGP